ncbi:MAG: hypothetical protein ACP6IY_12090 [Promethearchaeia archaeon]
MPPVFSQKHPPSSQWINFIWKTSAPITSPVVSQGIADASEHLTEIYPTG